MYLTVNIINYLVILLFYIFNSIILAIIILTLLIINKNHHTRFSPLSQQLSQPKTIPSKTSFTLQVSKMFHSPPISKTSAPLFPFRSSKQGKREKSWKMDLVVSNSITRASDNTTKIWNELVCDWRWAADSTSLVMFNSSSS